MTLPEGWVALREVPGGPEAGLLGNLLERNGIPVYLRYLRDLPGLEEGVIVAVPEAWLYRARTLVGDGGFSEAELSALAMESPPEADR
jgi:hypothetical protein